MVNIDLPADWVFTGRAENEELARALGSRMGWDLLMEDIEKKNR